VRLRDERRITLVLTTTDPEVIARLGVRVLELNQGRLTSLHRA
jgi:ABC-type glutathione transport system ATPase component